MSCACSRFATSASWTTLNRWRHAKARHPRFPITCRMSLRPKFRPLLVTMSGALLSTALWAATPPPSLPFDSITPSLRAKPITHLLMGRFIIPFELIGLANVQNAIGIGSMGYHGDGARAAFWLCYTLDSSLPHQRLWVMSYHEMGGPEQLVDRVTVRIADRAEATPDCPSLPKRFQPISFDHEFWLGKSESSMRATFGQPSKAIGEWREYYYVGKARDDGKCTLDGYDVTNGLTIKIEHGRVTEIDASQVTSC